MQIIFPSTEANPRFDFFLFFEEALLLSVNDEMVNVLGIYLASSSDHWPFSPCEQKAFKSLTWVYYTQTSISMETL